MSDAAYQSGRNIRNNFKISSTFAGHTDDYQIETFLYNGVVDFGDDGP